MKKMTWTKSKLKASEVSGKCLCLTPYPLPLTTFALTPQATNHELNTMHQQLTLKNSKIRPHKAVISPVFEAPTVLVSNMFEYVKLWLKRNTNLEAMLYWQQAENFTKQI